MELKIPQNKIRIELTNVKMHARTFRPTLSIFRKEESTSASERRLYPDGKPELQLDSENRLKMIIPFPEDLLQKIKNGEVEIEIPKDFFGLYLALDGIEKLEAMRKKKAKKLFFNTRIWRSR